VAARYAGVVADIAGEGHEVACSIDRRSVAHGGDLAQRLESLSGRVVHGCRIAVDPAIGGEARRGVVEQFDWESSLAPIPAWPRPSSGCSIPVRSVRIAGLVWPTDGLLLRQRPEPDAAQQVASWARSKKRRPLSFRLWELDDDLPRLAVLSPVQRWLCYRNLPLFLPRLRRLLDEARFLPVRAALGLAEERAARPVTSARRWRHPGR
jgi:hypothetical protein